MKITIERKPILAKITMAKSAIANKITELYYCLLFKVSQQGLSIIGGDGNNCIVIDANYKTVEGELKNFLISATQIENALSSIKDDEILLDVKESEMTIYHAHGKLIFPILNETGYSYLPPIAATEEIMLKKEDFIQGLNYAMPFAEKKEEFRPIISSVLMEIDNSKMKFIGTDAHRLMVVTYDYGDAQINNSIMIPQGAIKIINKVFAEQKEIALSMQNNKIQLRAEGINYSFIRIEGKFPNWRSIMPKDQPIAIDICRQLVIEAIERIQLLNANIIQFFSCEEDKTLKMTAVNIDLMTSGEEVIDDKYEGDKIDISFKTSNVLLALKAMNGEIVRFNMTDSAHSCLVNKGSEKDNIEILLMPCKVTKN